LLVAAKRHLVRRFLESLRHAGLRADLLQPDFIALHNFLAFEQFAAAGKGDSPHLPAAVEDAAAAKPPPAAAALDVGGDVTSLIVSSPQSLWFHSCGVAGRSFTRALVKELNLSVAQAEQLKRAPESALQIGPFQQALAPVFDDLLREVRQSLAVYAQAEPGRPVGQLFGLGGGFALHGMFRYFRCGR
jgi:Tfp pilus assembly PilM family ATPase